jgi:hypothetical protein
MLRTAIKLALFLVGGHLLLGMILLVIAATHGINDQDASFAVAMLFRCLNLPTVWVLQSAGGTIESQIVLILLVGIVQWAALAFAIAAIYHAFKCGFRLIADQPSGTTKPNTPADAQSLR